MSGLLPVHGFVLAGGKSTRMGRDKALLKVGGGSFVEIAVTRLREFCSAVSIVGERPDLAGTAPVVAGERVGCGPGAGIEAGLQACEQPWAMFTPVDVPFVPVQFLRDWVEEALRVKMSVSYLSIFQKQPAFCLLQRERLGAFSKSMDDGERRLEVLLNQTAFADGYASWMYDHIDLYGRPPDYRGPDEEELERWFMNVNSPEELEAAERGLSSIPYEAG